MLYDKEFIDSLPEPFMHTNSWQVAVQTYKKNEQLKKQIESWYALLPDEQKTKLYHRLRSFDDSEFVPAVYELLAFRYCKMRGWSVEYEPELDNGKTPDYIVTTREGFRFVLEVASMFESKDLQAAITREREVIDRISKIKTNFVFEISIDEWPPHGSKPAVAAAEVASFLQKLPENTKQHGCSFGRTIAGFAFSVNVRSDFDRPIVGQICSIKHPLGNTAEFPARLQDILRKKSTKYTSKKTGLPLIIMLGDAIGTFSGGVGMVDVALFGKRQITINADGIAKTPIAGRDMSGMFMPTEKAPGVWAGKSTGISGVLFASAKADGMWNFCLFNNPYPHIGIPEYFFNNIPQLLLTTHDGALASRWVAPEPDYHRLYID